jgi:hypothetical protein
MGPIPEAKRRAIEAEHLNSEFIVFDLASV